jgi:hypothetical protein
LEIDGYQEMIAQRAVGCVQTQLPAFGSIQQLGIEYESVSGNESPGAIDNVIQLAR